MVYCYDFLIELNLDNKKSIHKFSNIKFSKEKFGDLDVYYVNEYIYNEKKYSGKDQCVFRLNIDIQTDKLDL